MHIISNHLLFNIDRIDAAVATTATTMATAKATATSAMAMENKKIAESKRIQYTRLNSHANKILSK